MVMGCVHNGTTSERNPYAYLRRGCVFLCPFRDVAGNVHRPFQIHTKQYESASCGFVKVPPRQLHLVRNRTVTRQVITDLTLFRDIRLYAKSPHPFQHLRLLLDRQTDVPLERGLRLVT